MSDKEAVEYATAPSLAALHASHWLTRDLPDVPPMGLRVGFMIPGDSRYRAVFGRHVANAVRYALRVATQRDTIQNFDPDEFVEHVLTGLFGYTTDYGLSSEFPKNPKPVPTGLHSELLALMAGRCDLAPLYAEEPGSPR